LSAGRALPPLRILHVLRAPVGGLFRHVCDLALEQTARGHAVGVIADRSTGGEKAESALGALASKLSLGVSRIHMSRHAGPSDIAAVRYVATHVQQLKIAVVHGHGAKGGAFARLGAGKALRVYTPHGGSLHFSRANPIGFGYLGVESMLLKRTDLALFESEYAKTVFEQKIGKPSGITAVAHNGLGPEEFEPITPDANAADILFIGELRKLKGIDVLIEALALLKSRGQILRAVIAGDGPDREIFVSLAKARGVETQVTFTGAMPARSAFAKGKLLAVPSRAESLPYIVLEALAASVPVIATNVGGIPEIFGADANSLIPSGNPERLAEAIRNRLMAASNGETSRLRARVSELFTVSAMADGVLGAYERALAARAA
jgi:glycosyltransferase involved in cell wall biosynthesis